MPLETTQDANTEPTSSVAPAPAETPEVPNAAQTDEPTMADVARAAYEKASLAEGTKEEAESQGQQLTQTEEKEESPEKKKEETSPEKGEEKKEEKAVPDEQLPFHDHPRFKELIQQKNTYEQKVKSLEPLEKQWSYHQNFMQQHGITEQDFASAMNILALQKTDPAKAREALEPIWKSLQEFDPNVIPADLQKMVEDNEMTPGVAKMVAEMRAQLNGHKKSQVLSADQIERNRSIAVTNSIASWDQTKRGTDPDFRPKASQDAPDGLWEMTAAKFSYLQTVKFAQSPQEAIANLEQAYKDAKAVLTRYATVREPTKKTPTSTRSSSNAQRKPESVDDVVAAVARSHGYSYDGRHSGDEE